jgi:competence protein ComEC
MAVKNDIISMESEEMLRVTVKEVGQGDCIVLEWKNLENEWEIGIIDCNIHPTQGISNLVKQVANYRRITFLLLSHPHEDHFSGMYDFLEYCKAQKIGIEKIYHTSLFSKEYLQIISKKPLTAKKFIYASTDEPKELKKLILAFMEWEKLRGTSVFAITNQTVFDIPNMPFSISCISPTDKEIGSFIRKLKPFQVNLTDKTDSSSANLLSTVLYLNHEKWQILLTSDAEKSSFRRIKKSREGIYKPDVKKELLVCQVPHHGSVVNHAPDFWDSYIKINSVISAGYNPIYKHPREEVIKYFNENSKRIDCTNDVHGYKDFFSSNVIDELSFIGIEQDFSVGKDIIIRIYQDGCSSVER